jgi:signal recognition particle receptor subunit beta
MRVSRETAVCSVLLCNYEHIWPICADYDEVHGLVYVIDCADKERQSEAKDAFTKAVTAARILGKPVLVFANKQDLPDCLTATDVAKLLQIDAVKGACQVRLGSRLFGC